MSEWRTSRLRYLLRLREVVGHPEAELLSVYREHGVIRKADREDNHNKPGGNLALYQVVRPGDLVMNRMKAWQGSLGISSYDGIVSPDYYVCSVASDLDSRFMHHLLRSQPMIAEYGKRSTGIRSNQWRLPWGGFSDIPIDVPDRDTQRQIGLFLDSEVSQISELTQRLEELVAGEWEAVRALRAELLHSDESVALRHCSVVLDHRRVPMNETDRSARPGPYPYWGANTVQGYVDDYLFDDDLVLIAEDGGPFFDPRRDVAWVVSGKLWVNNHAHILKPREGWSVDYLAEALNAVDYSLYITGATRDKLTQEALRAIRVPKRPLDEQVAVAQRVREAKERYQALRSLALNFQEGLKKYRDALVAEAVTGTLDPLKISLRRDTALKEPA